MASSKPELSEQQLQKQLIAKVRKFVNRQLSGGAEPSQVGYVLTLVATEMGLFLAENAGDVYPVILQAVLQAAEAKRLKDAGSEENVRPALIEHLPIEGETVH